MSYSRFIVILKYLGVKNTFYYKRKDISIFMIILDGLDGKMSEHDFK